MSFLIPAPATAGGGTFTYAATPPGSPAAGDTWYDSDLGILFTYINDGNTSQWVETAPGGLVGPAGPQGIQGVTGDTGATGATGGSAVAFISSVSGSITNSETVVTSISTGANTLTVGRLYRITALAKRTGTNNSGATFRVRIGPTTLTGAIASTVTLGNSTAESALLIEMWVGIQTIGAGGTTAPGGATTVFGTTALASTTLAVSVDTTAINLIEFTAVTANSNNSFVFSAASMEKVT